MLDRRQFVGATAAADIASLRAADAIKPAVSSPDVVEACAKLGLEAMANTAATLAQRTREENAQWGPIVSNPMHLDDAAIAFPDMQIIIAHPSWRWQDEALLVAVHKPNARRRRARRRRGRPGRLGRCPEPA